MTTTIKDDEGNKIIFTDDLVDNKNYVELYVENMDSTTLFNTLLSVDELERAVVGFKNRSF